MILVDTSVLIDFFRQKKNEATDKFDDIIARGIPFGIADLIYLEVLQGGQTVKDFHVLKKYLDTQVFYSLQRGRESFALAAEMYMRCRQQGVTVRSTIDCLVCQIAIENNLRLLHHDADFIHIAKVIRELQIY